MSEGARGDDPSVRYRSRAGVVGLHVWAALVAGMGLLDGWEAVRKGELPWHAGVPLMILAAGLYTMFVELTLSGDGELVFQGLVRRRSWDVSRLRSIRRGSMCVVFRFDGGGAMLAWGWQPDPDWAAMVERLRDLNPGVQIAGSLTGGGPDGQGT